jgi:ABC-type hemin transport system substrate-binding protein
MNARTPRTCFTGWLLAFVVAACGQPAARAPDGPARRIVSLAPSITELLFELGAGGQVVGRTAYCKYPPAALAVPR